MSSNFLLSVFQIRLLSLSSLTTSHFLDRKGINLRVDDYSSKEATSEYISKARAILYGGERKQQATLKEKTNKQMRR